MSFETIIHASRHFIYPMTKCILASLLACVVGLCAPNATIQPALAQTDPSPQTPIDKLAPYPAPLAGPVYSQPHVAAPSPAPLPTPTPVPQVAPTPQTPQPEPVVESGPPTAQAYVNSPSRNFDGQVFVPASFFSSHLGASVGPVGNRWRLIYYHHQIDFLPWQRWVIINGKQGQLPTMTRILDGELYVPIAPFAKTIGLNWSRIKDDPKKSVFLIQFPAAYIENVRSSIVGSKVRTVLELSNPTRVQAFQNKLDAGFVFSGARTSSKQIPTVQKVGDYLVPHTTLKSGNWNANFAVKLNYSAPISWFTLGNPPRLVIDAQRLFEQTSTENQGGIALTKIRRGTGHGPVQMYVARLDPKDGWRVRVQPGGYSVLQRALPSRLAARHKAVLAVNGGFFAYDGAALGAVLVDGEWIRLPWQGRTAVGFTADGTAHINNLQVDSYVDFSGGLRIPIRDLNGWPDKNRVTALTRRFGTYYQLRAGEMALVVKDGKVIARPGGGGANIPEGGFTLVANGSARPWLEKVTLGQRAKMTIKPKNWPKITTALGGGPGLVKNSKIEVTNENFRVDVKNGTAPRTAFGVDKQGRYIILIADGRDKFHSTGLTLQELAATMQKLGAVHAMNLDGGGSTSLAVRGKVINRPSDGRERSVANALLVMR
jgi:exopolysaccharide biosynthesis protein